MDEPRGRRRAAVTLEDVALAAGVSRATASRALLEVGPPSTPARAAVRAVAERLGFRPDPAARALAGGAGTRVVVVAVGPDPHVLDCSYVEQVTGAVAGAADRHGVGVSARWSPPDGGPSFDDLAADRTVRGVVLVNTTWAVLARVPAGLHGRVVSIGAGTDEVPSIDVDNLGGAAALLHHLVASGRRRIAMIEPPAANVAAARLGQAYRAVLAGSGLPVRVVPGDYGTANGRAGAAEILRRWPDTDAVFAPNDDTAVGVIAALQPLGVGVPPDVAVVGFGDDPVAALPWLGLTTATHPARRIAAAAAELLLGPPAAGPVHRLLPSVPVFRRTA
jgi:DNA-binding LacI/PurR family transcriptional regulator